MPQEIVFDYVAIDHKGFRVLGQVAAAGDEEVKCVLLARDLAPLTIDRH